MEAAASSGLGLIIRIIIGTANGTDTERGPSGQTGTG